MFIPTKVTFSLQTTEKNESIIIINDNKLTLDKKSYLLCLQLSTLFKQNNRPILCQELQIKEKENTNRTGNKKRI